MQIEKPLKLSHHSKIAFSFAGCAWQYLKNPLNASKPKMIKFQILSPRLQFQIDSSADMLLLDPDTKIESVRRHLRKQLDISDAHRVILVYHNIGFTGSSSFSSSLGRAFDTAVYGYEELNCNSGEEFIKRVAERCSNKRLISIHTRAPSVAAALQGNCFDIQLLRAPEKVYTSIYYWHLKLLNEGQLTGPMLDSAKGIADRSFESYVNDYIPGLPNTVSRGILISMLNPRDFLDINTLISYAHGISDDELYSRVRDGLLRYGFVGITEYMSESLFSLLFLLGENKFPLWPKVGVSSAPPLDQMDVSLREKIRNICQVDCKIYDEFHDIFLSRYAEPITAFRKSIGSLCAVDKTALINKNVPAPIVISALRRLRRALREL